MRIDSKIFLRSVGTVVTGKPAMEPTIRVAIVAPSRSFPYAWDFLKILRARTAMVPSMYIADEIGQGVPEHDVVHAIGLRSIVPALQIRAGRRVYSCTVSTYRENVSVLNKYYHATYEPFVHGEFLNTKRITKGKPFKWTPFPCLNTARPDYTIPELPEYTRPLLVWGRKPRTNSPEKLLRAWKTIKKKAPSATLIVAGGKPKLEKDLLDQKDVHFLRRIKPKLFNGLLHLSDVVYSIGINKGMGNTTVTAMKYGKPVMYIEENVAPQLKHMVNAFRTENTEEGLAKDTLYVIENLEEITKVFSEYNVPRMKCINWTTCGTLMSLMYKELFSLVPRRSAFVYYKKATADLPW